MVTELARWCLLDYLALTSVSYFIVPTRRWLLNWRGGYYCSLDYLALTSVSYFMVPTRRWLLNWRGGYYCSLDYLALTSVSYFMVPTRRWLLNFTELARWLHTDNVTGPQASLRGWH